MELRTVRLGDPETEPVLADLADEYRRRYGGDGEMGTTAPEEFDPPAGRFLVLVDRDETVAAGGYRYLAEGVCELKRMWTHPDRRRAGLGRRLLTALESEARSAGYRRLLLETGPAQPEAVALYTAGGYEPVAPYGRYPTALAFAKDLLG